MQTGTVLPCMYMQGRTVPVCIVPVCIEPFYLRSNLIRIVTGSGFDIGHHHALRHLSPEQLLS